MSLAEDVYDNEIAPLLLKLAEQCREMEISFVAAVEYEPGKISLTKAGESKSTAQAFAVLAAECNGNVDGALLALVKRFGPGNSLYLRHRELY